jgi:ribosomal protein L40E
MKIVRTWICGKCNSRNTMGCTVCWNCGEKKRKKSPQTKLSGHAESIYFDRRYNGDGRAEE